MAAPMSSFAVIQRGSEALLHSNTHGDRGFRVSSALTNNADSVFKQDYFSYHIKFIIISSGNITPSWKLVRLATGNG
jgi:hypothetical protein